MLFKFHALIPAKSFARIVFTGTLIWLFSLAMGDWAGLLMIAKAIALCLAYIIILVLLKEIGRRDFRVLLKMLR